MSEFIPGEVESLRIKYETHEPIEVSALGQALVALADDFRAFYKNSVHRPTDFSDREYEILIPTLVIDRTENGSLLLWISVKYTQLKGWADSGISLIQYAQRLKKLLDFYTGKSKDKPDVGLKELHNAMRQIMPSVAGTGAPMLLEAKKGEEIFSLYYGADALRLANNRLRSESKFRERAVLGDVRERVVFYWYRATFDPEKNTGDQGVIEEISDKAITTRIYDAELKKKMLEGPIANRSYVVTVKVSTRQSIPILYQILELHEILD